MADLHNFWGCGGEMVEVCADLYTLYSSALSGVQKAAIAPSEAGCRKLTRPATPKTTAPYRATTDRAATAPQPGAP